MTVFLIISGIAGAAAVGVCIAAVIVYRAARRIEKIVARAEALSALRLADARQVYRARREPPQAPQAPAQRPATRSAIPDACSPAWQGRTQELPRFNGTTVNPPNHDHPKG